MLATNNKFVLATFYVVEGNGGFLGYSSAVDLGLLSMHNDNIETSKSAELSTENMKNLPDKTKKLIHQYKDVFKG